MEPQGTYKKTVLRHLQSKDPRSYITTRQQRIALHYPEHNCDPIPILNHIPAMLSLDCEMVMTTKGNELCQVLILNEQGEVIYDRWFRPRNEVIDYVTHITGLDKQTLDQRANSHLQEADLEYIHSLINNKILIGHDLSNDLRVLPLKHSLFMDTVALYPHNLGLPFKNKLKHLSTEVLNRHIQWGAHDPKEDAQAALDIVKVHISKGMGTVEQVEADFPQKLPFSSFEVLWKEAELESQQIVGFFLRGSRALGLTIDLPGYVSDWDYFCVYRTTTTINGRLIKLHMVDITIYDEKSFNRHVENNDIACLEMFYLPKEFQYINTLPKPVIDIGLLHQTVNYHENKSQRKVKRFRKELTGDKKTWKILKALHLQVRFYDYFLQIFERGQVYDIKRVTKIWDQVKEMFIKTQDYPKTEEWLQKIVTTYHQQVRKVHLSSRPMHNLAHETRQKKRKENAAKVYLRVVAQDQMTTAVQKYLVGRQQPTQQVNPLGLSLVEEIITNGLQRVEQLSVLYKRHKHYPNLLQFHYKQSANFIRKLCHESRGIILDQQRNFEVVSLPYFKFFDYNDPKYSEIKEFDFEDCRIYEKYDGSIAMLYNYGGEWMVSSATVPDGEASYCFSRTQTTTQFKRQFWKIFYKLGFKVPEQSDADYTFVFQLMSKDHIIVVRRSDSDLRLTGVRCRRSGREFQPQSFGLKYNWSYAAPLPIKITCIEQVQEMVKGLNPHKQEGFILRDKHWRRMKIKNADYVRANWLSELNLTPNQDPKKYLLGQVVLSGQMETFCEYCPEWKGPIQSYIAKIDYLNEKCLNLSKKYENLTGKQLALEIKKQNSVIQPFLYALCRNPEKWTGKLQYLMSARKLYDFLEQIEEPKRPANDN